MIWLALAFMIAATFGAAGYAAARGWRLWRTLGGTMGRATAAVERVAESAAKAEERATALTAKSDVLSDATARLQVSLAELAVIRDAASEPRALLANVRGAVPRK